MVFLRRLLTFALLALGKPLRIRCEDLEPADVIVVPGTTVRPDGSPSEGMVFRVHHAVELFNQGLSQEGRLILTGGGKDGEASEAQAMLELTIALGLKEDASILETQSSRTADNALKAKLIMDQEGWQSAVIVTSPYHVKRAVKSFRLLGIKALGSEAFSPVKYPLPTHVRVIAHEYSAWVSWWANDILNGLRRGLDK